MITILDPKKQIISLYHENGIKEIPFEKIDDINKYAHDEIYYVTNAKLTTTDEIIKLVYKLTNRQNPPPSPQNIITDNKNMYMCLKEDTIIKIPDINLTLEGKYDIKIIDNELKNKIRQSKLLQSLVQKGIVILINAFQREELLQEKQNKKDKKINNIIVDRDTMEEKGANKSKEDAIKINMDGDKGGGRTMTQLLSNIENS